MALVPYRVSGPAADQRADERLFQVAGLSLRIRQLPGQSGSLRPGTAAAAATSPAGLGVASSAGGGGVEGVPASRRQIAGPHGGDPAGAAAVSAAAAAAPGALAPAPSPPLSALSHVGLVVWQSGFVLADYMLRNQPCGWWVGLQCVELGAGTGLVGIALAMAGAQVVLTDLPHVTALAQLNVDANVDDSALVGRAASAAVVPYAWGDDPAPVLRAVATQRAARQSVLQAGAANAAACSQPPAPPVAHAGPAAAGGVEEAGGSRAWGAGPLLVHQQPGPDVIVAADVLYHEDLHAPLLRALSLLAAPHTAIFIGYKARSAREAAAFADAADAGGFAVEAVQRYMLHEEYRDDGTYGILRLARRDAQHDEHMRA